MKVVLFYDWEKPAQRLHGTTAVLRNLVRIAGLAKAAEPGPQKQRAPV
jgi:transcription-repair coupling factor (superfamily II helicase)